MPVLMRLPHNSLGFSARLRLVEENIAVPAIDVGFSSQGKGAYVESLHRYSIKSPGFYAVVAQGAGRQVRATVRVVPGRRPPLAVATSSTGARLADTAALPCELREEARARALEDGDGVALPSSQCRPSRPR